MTIIPSVFVLLLLILSGSGDALSVVHITDVHIDPFYVTGSPTTQGCYCETHDSCARMPLSCAVGAAPFNESAPPFGAPEGNCATPPALWEGAMSALSDSVGYNHTDFAIFTGDFGEAGMSAPCASTQPAEIAITTNIARAMTSVRGALGGSVKVYGVLGNHDTAPGDVFDGSDEMAWLYSSLVSSFGDDFAHDESALASLLCCGWYSTPSPVSGLRIVALNTNYWTELNPLLRNISSPASLLGNKQLDWLNQTLATATENNEIVWILAHIPPVSWVDGRYDAFRTILTLYKNTVAAEFFGHDHVDEFFIVRECIPTSSPPNNKTTQWVETTGVNWCSGGNWNCGDVFGAGLMSGELYCPLLPSSLTPSQGVIACESICGNSSICEGFTYYPQASPNGACCMRTNCDSKPLNASSSAVCYEKAHNNDEPCMTGENYTKPLHMAFVGPSMTEGYPPSNPALRRYDVADVSGQFAVTDFTTYFANLTRANANWELEFEVEYVAKAQYQLPDLSANSFEALATRMAVNGSSAWDSFFSNHYKSYRGPSLPVCNSGTCKDDLLQMINGTNY